MERPKEEDYKFSSSYYGYVQDLNKYIDYLLQSQQHKEKNNISESFTRKELLAFYVWLDNLPYNHKEGDKIETVEVDGNLLEINEALDYWKSNVGKYESQQLNRKSHLITTLLVVALEVFENL